MAFDNSPLGRGETAVAVSPLLVRKTIDEVADFGDDKLANEAAAIDATMERVVEAAGPDFDLTRDEVGKIDGFSGNAADRATKFVELHSRGAGIQNVMAKRHAAAEAQAEFLQLREDALKANLGDISGAAQPTSRTNPAFLSTDVLSQICDKYGLKATNDVLKQAVNIAGETGFTISSEVDVNRYLNATVTTDAGYDPFVTRQPGITRFISRPLQVIDTMPRASTMQHSIKFMIQVVRAAPTDAQMAVAEGAASTEASMQWWEYDEPMRELAAHIPVTEVQMEDVAQIRAIIDEDLRLMVLQSLDGELLIGPGTSNRIRGIATSRTINGTATSPLKFTWSKNNNTAAGRRNDQLKDMKRAKTRLKITARVMPNVVYMRDETWDEISLLETTAAGFYLGSPANDFQPMIWSLPVVLTDHLSDNINGNGTGINAIMADTMYLRHWMRRTIHSEIGRINDQFIERTWTIRAGLRCCVQVRRPQAVMTFSNA